MPNTYVHKALELLSQGLDSHITEHLAPVLGGLDWVTVLQELDLMKGKAGWTYSRSDVALQLRMITERLGALGHPFDQGDQNRTMSSYGSVLRIVRKRWAHNDQFDPFDALSAVDTVRIVLTHISDTERAQRTAALRSELVANLLSASSTSANSSIVADASEVLPAPLGLEAPEEQSTAFGTASSSRRSAGQSAVAVPAKLESSTEIREILKTQDPESSGTTVEIEWEEWRVAVVGQKGELENFRSKKTREVVRSLIEEIVDSEGPIHQDRLARLVGLGFGFSRLSKERAKGIKNQIFKSDVAVDPHGFVWAKEIDTNKWLVYRKSAPEERSFEQIAPIEIANAACALSTMTGNQLDTPELAQNVLEYFGRKNRTAGAVAHLSLGMSQALVRNPKKYA